MSYRDEIRQRLDKLPRQAAAAVAVRAAMRVLPVLALEEGQPFYYWSQGNAAMHCLAILRCYQVSIFGNSLPEIDAAVAFAARSASASASYASTSASTYIPPFASSAAAAFSTAFASAFAASASAVTARSANVSLDASTFAARSADASSYTRAFSSSADFAADELYEDLHTAEKRSEIIMLLARSLWTAGVPDEVQHFWKVLQSDFQSLNAGFDVWIDWYQDRLEGRPLNLELERKWALLPDDILAKSPSEVNSHLKLLRDEHLSNGPWGSPWGPSEIQSDKEPDAGASGEILPDLPTDQEPGLQFALQEDGKIGQKPSGFAPPDDVAEILTMRGVIVEALDDLIGLLDGSNAYVSIATVAQRYKSAISAGDLSVDMLYAYGVRLENSRSRLAVEIKSGDFPDLAVPAGEALDSIIALHGPVVYSTARGRVLTELARAFQADGLDVSAYKPVAQHVASAIDKAEAAVTELARETIKQASDEIGEGEHPERSTQIARTALSNFMIAAAKGVQNGFAPETVADGVKDGIKDGHKTIAKWGYVGGATAVGIAAYAAAPALLSFFIANQALLHHFSAVAGCELSWLPSFLNWLERQRARLNV